MKATSNIPNSPVDATSTPAAPGTAVVESRYIKNEKFDFWRNAHRALRGRYRFAIGLAVVCAIAGAAIGSRFGQRIYSSTGLVRIASVRPQVLRATDQNTPMAMFDGFIQAQRDVMISREMIQSATQEETWKRAKRSGQAPTDEQFAAALKVETRPRSDHLKITFTDKDPAIAAAAVQSIIAAYQQTYVNEQDRVEAQRVDELKSRQAGLAAELKKLEEGVGPDADGHTADELEPVYNAAADRAKKLRAALADVQCAIAGVPDLNNRPPPPERLPYENVADELLHSYVEAQARCESDLEAAANFGYGKSHPTMIRLEAAVAESRQRVQKYVQEYEIWRSNRASGPSPVSLADREANLRRLAEATEEEMKQIAARRAQLTVFEAKSAAIRESLKETEGRLDALITEASLGSRLTVISNGNKPMTASTDNRAKVAAVGAILGSGIPLGLLILQGSIRRKYQYCDEVAEDLLTRVPFMAVLPDVSASSMLGSAASRCVNDLRVRLQPRNPDESRVYLMTSTSPGEGTTSLTLSLALSCAAAGFRTLVIDCNLISRGVTLGFDAGSSAGMIEALAGEEQQVRRVHAGPSVLPTGQARTQDVFKLAPATLRGVLADLRERFDMILIDGEPILTGNTSSVIAPQVDGVFLLIARGQEQALLNGAMAQIEALGAELSGVVFNRAADSDFPAVVREQTTAESDRERQLPSRLTRFGSLVNKMLVSLSLSRETDLDLIPLPARPAWPENPAEAA